MEITVENLERALSQFYHTDSTLQAEAHQWLTAVQSSPNAWALVWELLTPERSSEAQFYAATTLHTKIMKNWTEVPSDQYGILKDKIIQTVLQYSQGPKIVLNRLCIALSAFIIQTAPHFWKNSIPELINLFRPESLPNIEPERCVWILLEVLTVIPEEFQTIVLSQSHKNSVVQELVGSAAQVISVLEGILECNDYEIVHQGVKASIAWLHFGVPLPSCLPLAGKLVNSFRKQAAMSFDGEPESEALIQMGTHPDTHFFPSGVLSFLDVILPLKELAKDPDNPDLVANVYKTFVLFAETHASLLLKALASEKPKPIIELLEIMVACTAGPGIYPTQETHSQLTFAFWYILQDELYTVRQESLKDVTDILVPVYEQVTNILLRKAQYPADGITLSSADAELFRCYRQDIADTMVYCYQMVKDYMITLLSNTLQNSRTWQEVECVFHVAFAIAETTKAEDDSKIISLLASTPGHLVNTKVINTHNQAIGAYAEWFSQNGDALGALIPGLVASMQNSETAMSSTMALKDITRECSTSLKPYAEHLLSACQETLSKGHLRQAECVRIMILVGRLLSIIPYEKMTQLIDPIIANYTSSFEQLLSEEPSPQVKSVIVLRLKMLGTMCGTLYLDENIQVEPPGLIVLKRIIPSLVAISQKWSSDASVVQEICSCFKSAVTSLPEDGEELLETMLSTVVHCYNSQPNIVALELVKQIVILFGFTKTSICAMLLNSVTSSTLSIASQQSNPSDASELLQGFHNLLSGVVKRNAEIISCSVDTSQVFKFATLSLLLPENGTVKAAGSFLCHFITESREIDSFTTTVQENGENLVSTCIRCIGNDAPRSALDTFSEILFFLNKKYCDSLSRWLSNVMAPADFPTSRATQDVKSHFTRMVLRERANKRKLQDTVREFALVCRGLVHS